MKTFELIFVLFLFSTSALNAQQSTTGPYRPKGVSKGIIQNNQKSTNTIIGVPSYIWHRGCGPTALGMVIGYYDTHGFTDLIDGDASTQTSYVNDAIANSNHYSDYSLPIDSPPNLLADKSQLGGAHSSNCIADFMNTSWSSRSNYWGWSWSNDIAPAFTNYIQMRNSTYVVSTSYQYFNTGTSWNNFKSEIDSNKPVVLLVDSNGDGYTDHFVTGIGYDDTGMLYAIYDTWDHSIHWYQWRSMSSNYSWGIYGYDILNIEPLSTSYITVTDPNGGENWLQGSSQYITWDDNISENVKIQLYKGSNLNSIITNSISSNGSYSWTVPSGQTPGSDYRIKITSTTNSSLFDYSNSYFTISTTLPSSPSTLTATATSSSQINLSWSNIANEDGYYIFRANSLGGTYSYIATTNTNVITYANTGLLSNTEYCYKVKAYNSAGNSGDSPANCATTNGTVQTNLLIQNLTIYNGQNECYNATNTITVAGSGTTVNINSGGEATYIAGEKILFEPGFSAHPGSHTEAYITTTGEYCNQQQSMMTNNVIIEDGGTKALINIPMDDASDELVVNIYPNPTTGNFTIDFMGKETTADITVLNFQGNKIRSLECYNQVQAEVDISYLPAGMYIIIIKTETDIIKKKLTMLK